MLRRRSCSLKYLYLKGAAVSLSIGIDGPAHVGKSTLFTALTKKTGLAANYPFATIDPNVGIVDVPDSRLQKARRHRQPRPHCAGYGRV